MKKLVLATAFVVAALCGNNVSASAPSQDKQVVKKTTTVKKATPSKKSTTAKTVHKKHVKHS